MKNILILGGTRFLGLELIDLLKNEDINLFIASRKEIKVDNFIKIDRKNQNDLNNLFSKYDFEFVIDFINYSGLDSIKLLKSLKLQKTPPKLILISTVYIYSNPIDLETNSEFVEKSFNPLNHDTSFIDRPNVSYSQGKRDMECYCTQNYNFQNLVILRFPIILGYNDYTKRTHFYAEIIKNKNKINPINIYKKSCYIFSFEAAKSILNFINSEHHGIFNIAFNSISEFDLFNIYCKYYKIEIDSLLNGKMELVKTPFSTTNDFIVNSNRYNSLFPTNLDFKKSLERELTKITL